MKRHQDILLKKFQIKRTKGVKRVKKSDTQLKKEIQNKMRIHNSVGVRPTKKVCNAYLSEQIRQNVRSGKWSYKQAIAIAYQQTQKRQKGCKKYYIQ